MSNVISVLLIVLVIIILFSWIANAAGFHVRSLFSAEGIRWSFVHSVNNTGMRGLVYVILTLSACGAVLHSGMWETLVQLISPNPLRPVALRQKRALLYVLFIICLCFVFLIALLLMPESILLSATGRFYPSPLSQGLFLSLNIATIIVSLAFGAMSNRFRSTSELIHTFYYGFERFAPFITVYVLMAYIYFCLSYIFALDATSFLKGIAHTN